MPDSWYYDDFATSAEPAGVESLALPIPYTPDASAPCAVADDCGCFTVGETKGFLFFPVAAGTLTPEVPQAIVSAENYEVLLKGFGLAVPIEATDANGKLTADTGTGRITAVFDDDDVAGVLPNSFGTVELWQTSPVRAVLARRRYKAYP